MSALRHRYSRRRQGSAQRPAIRTVEVVSPSNSDEASWVFLTGAFIILGVIYISAFERYGWDSTAPATNAGRAGLPYQVLFRDLPAPEQRMFRAMQEGAAEAIRLRGSSGRWPAVEALASDGIPPFATDPLDKAGVRWSLEQAELTFNYLGIASASSEATSFLILIREPDPVTGEKVPPPSVIDEEHQLLGESTLLHVTYWKRSSDRLRPAMILDPAMEGWLQIRVKSLFEEAEGK